MKRFLLASTIILVTNCYGQNIGINTTTANYPITMPSTLGDKISLWGGDLAPNGIHYGFGVQSFLLQIFGATGADIAFGTGRSAAFVESGRISGLGEFSCKGTAAGYTFYDRNDPNTFAKRFVWYNINDAARLFSGTFGDVITLEHTGDVGIGTGNPTAKLHVNGSLRVVNGTQASGRILTSDANGNATWDDYTRLDTLSLGPGDFTDRDGTANISRSPGTFFTVAGPGFLIAPLHLPQGSELTRVTIWFRDNVADNLSVQIARIDLATGSVNNPFATTTSGAMASFRSQSFTTPGFTISNHTHAYYLIANSANWPGNSNLQIEGLVVEYSYKLNR